jgi:dTMP kinase
MGDPGPLIAFEGVEGAGKSTQLELLRRALEGRSREVVVTREPGGTPAGERIRALLLDPRVELHPRAEALLFAAARAEHVEKVIRPALDRGAWVVCDRFLDSSLVYQGIARGLGVEQVLELNRPATGGLMPARTFVLVLDVDAARSRQGDELDRIEREDEPFRRVVADGYRELGILFPKRVSILDGSQPAETIAEQVREQVRVL